MSEIINPGQQKPWTIPFCASCKTGVEEMTFHTLSAPGAFEIECRCHGKTTSVLLDAHDVARIKKTGEPVIVFKGPLRQLVNAIVRS